MNEFLAFSTGTNLTRTLATSALPDAPVMPHIVRRSKAHGARGWAAARLRGMARSTYHLANRVDPVRLPSRGAPA